MTPSTSPFRFDDTALATTPGLVAEIPAGIKTKEALFDELYRQLHFPDYFGGNWDALEECIRDLSWVPAGSVILRHYDLPLVGDVANQKTYLSILRGAVEKKRAVPGQHVRDLVVIFPPEAREQVGWLLRVTGRYEPT